MPGYKNRTLVLDFPELSEDGDRVYLVMRNPRTVPFEDLQPREVPLDASGQPIDAADARAASYELFAKLAIGGRLYDAALPQNPDPAFAEQETDQPLLTFPISGEQFARLPVEIQSRVAQEVRLGQNPRSTPDTSTSS